MAGGMHGGGGHAWQWSCVAGGVHGRGYVWQRCAWQGGMLGRIDGHCSGRYASYWNAFLFL